MLEAVTAYVRRKRWVVVSLVVFWGAIYCANDVAISFHSYSGFVLILDLLLDGCFVAWIAYSIRQPDFWGYTIVSAAIILIAFSSALWFAIHIRDFGSFAFGNAYRAFDYY